MNSYTDFINMLDKIYLQHSDLVKSRPSELLEYWDSFVSQCEEGYMFDICEYKEDIKVRLEINNLISFDELNGFEEFKYFKNCIRIIDDRLRVIFSGNVTLPHVEHEWWLGGVLKYSGSDYAKDLKSIYGIDVLVK